MIKDDYKLFTIGPTQMYESTLAVRSRVVPYFRTSEFSEMMFDNERLIKKFQFANDSSKVVFLTASGSGAMEATVINCFNRNDKLLIISGGTFGERFEKICEIHHLNYETIKLKPDEELKEKHFQKYDGKGFNGLLVNIDETSTGQLYNINIIREFCDRNNIILVVDAISSFLADPYYMEKNHIDVTIISSQKGLCLAPGLSIITFSQRSIDKIINNEVESLYFNFKDYFINMERGQTPFTPAVGVCFELNDMLHKIDVLGVEERIQEVKRRCNYFREEIRRLPVSIPKFPLSNAVTPVKFEKDIAIDFFDYMKNEKHILVNPSGGIFKINWIRVSHVGDLSLDDYNELIGEIEKFM